MRALALPRGDRWLIVAGAGLTILAYPPFHLLFPSFTCLVPAVLLIVRGGEDPLPLRRQLVQGWWFGLASHGLVLYWIIVALWHFTPLSAAGYAATILILALWTALLFAATGWVGRRLGVGPLIAFPVMWTAVEWAIGHQGDIRFPWLGIGSSLTGFPVLVQIAEVIGARGVTLALAVANAALALAWLQRRDRRRAAALAGGVAAGIALAACYGLVRMRIIETRSLGTVAAIQPAVGFQEKWDARLRDSIVNGLFDLSEQTLRESDPDLVLWPEAALPHALDYFPAWGKRLAEHARGGRVPLVVGGVDVRTHPDGSPEFFNAAFVFDSAGQRNAVPYHKRYLVPIVERVPFVNPRWFSALRWFGAFGVGPVGTVYQVPMGRFGILICYESAFEDLSRRYRREGADFVVNITNDAWFGNTAAPYQHAAHLVMRAIENRVGIARAANTGISEFVDPFGREHDRTRLGDRTLVVGQVRTSDVRTFYTRVGDWVGTLTVATALLLLGAAWWRRPRP
ncbi:MAG: apolipoprotein N-acyltransferase [Gemmatimonadetes bacterium]|nr:apolipoprotein N-acyltransferase [Gemmatimonadota bacterium]